MERDTSRGRNTLKDLLTLSRIRRVCAMVCAICACFVVLGCSEVWQNDEETYEVVIVDNPIEPALTDDTAPEPSDYDGTLTYMGRYDVEENHSTDRFRFDVAAYLDEAEREEAEQLFPSHSGFLNSHDADAIPSVQTIGTYFKQIDDTIYAGIEQAVQVGLEPTLQPKQNILSEALDYLVANRSSAADEAIIWVSVALRLGGATPTIPTDLIAAVEAVESDFLASDMEAKPIGFYTWSEQLQQIWRQDRMLQRELPSPESSCALAAAIGANPDRQELYLRLTELYSKLTNPLRSSLVDMLDIGTEPSCSDFGTRAFLSASRTPEVTLFEELYPLGVPPETDLMADLISAIRDGLLDLAPRPEHGWYQYQLYALETLLVTDNSEERAKIAFMARYKERLQEAFTTMLVQHRETHVKQTGPVPVAAPELFTPHFRLEPLATVYVRHARSYVFLETALDAVMGSTFLDTAVAVDADGNMAESLRERIHHGRDLFYGLYIVACQDIGLGFSLDAVGDPGVWDYIPLGEAADQWLLDLPDDSIAQADVRVMIPIAYLAGDRAKYWAVLGVRATIAGYSYIGGTDVSPPDPEDQARVWLPTEQFLEVESSATPLTREEFRELCDQHQTAAAIQAALEAR